MLALALTFLLLAILFGVFGFGVAVGLFAAVAKVLLIVFLVMLLVTLVSPYVGPYRRTRL